MKNLFLALSLALTVGFTSCSSDDDNSLDNLENAILYRGVERSLKTSLIEFWGSEAQGSYAWDVSLVSSNFTVNEETEDFDFEEDIVTAILMELNTSNSTSLQVGVYEIDEDDFSPFKCSYADVLWECDFSNLEEENEEEDIEDACAAFLWLESGTVEVVSVTSNTITIKVDALTFEGESLKAHYSGAYLSFLDRTAQPSKPSKQKSFKQKARK